MPKSGGIPGLAVAMATAGLFLVYVGVRDVPVVEGLREIVRGKSPTARPKATINIPDALRFSRFNQADDGGQFGSGGGGSSPSTGNARIAEAGKKYIGVPYRWGGHDPNGFDCSGFVTWVLVRDMGMTNLPSQVHTTTIPFLNWSGARSIKREECAAGDLVCWVGHIGIAVNNTEMVHAPQPGEKVKIGKISGIPPAPVIRRVQLPNTGGGGGMQTR